MPSKPTRIFIGRIPHRCSERDLERFFKNYGRIKDVILKSGYGFVEFEDYRDADDAVYELNGKDLLGERVTVEHARGVARRGPPARDQYQHQQQQRRPTWLNRYGPPQRTPYRVLVENLSSKVSWQDLKDYMRKAGEITFADAHRKRKNEGMVEFASYSDMKRCVEKMDGIEIMHRKIKLTAQYRRSRSGSNSRRSRSRRRSYSRSKSASRSRSRSASRSRSRSVSKPRKNFRSRSKSSGRDSRSKSPAKRGSRSKSPVERKAIRESHSKSPRDSRSKSPVRRRNSRESLSTSPVKKRNSRELRSKSRESRSKSRESEVKSPVKRKSPSRSGSEGRKRSRSPIGGRSRSASRSPAMKRRHASASPSSSRGSRSPRRKVDDDDY